MANAPSSEVRRQRLRRILQTSGFASLGDLSERLEVSESTVRRDLDSLEQSGDAKRTHGGVIWTGSAASMRVFRHQDDESLAAKRKIAVAAAALIEDHQTIFLDGGSTTYELTRELVGRPLQVVTNSLPVANLISSSQASDLILIGGMVDVRSGVTMGPIADQNMRSLRVANAFLSTAAIQEDGYYNRHMMLVETERTMIEIADHTTIVADSSKFGRSSLSRLCGLDAVDRLVTNENLAPTWKTRLSRASVDVVFAQ
ncbi:MAG: DeoR/GlpR family DNA-binding transcription regulator [Planctomycetota bacterium]